MLRRQRIDKLGDAIDTANVKSVEKAFIAGRFEFLDYRSRLASCTHRDGRSAFRECQRNRLTDTAETTRNYGNPAIQVTLHRYHSPTVGIEAQGSAGGRGCPFCSSSIEILSGERKNAIWPSRGGTLIVIPASSIFWQSA